MKRVGGYVSGCISGGTTDNTTMAVCSPDQQLILRRRTMKNSNVSICDPIIAHHDAVLAFDAAVEVITNFASNNLLTIHYYNWAVCLELAIHACSISGKPKKPATLDASRCSRNF